MRLFVYGSLAPNRSHHYLLAGISGNWQRARVRGRLYPGGIGRTRGWPALKRDPQADWVNGYLLTSRELPGYWRRLDAFEGSAYRRVKAWVLLDDGQLVNAQLYEARQVIRLYHSARHTDAAPDNASGPVAPE